MPLLERVRAGISAFRDPQPPKTPSMPPAGHDLMEIRGAIQQNIRARYDTTMRTPENARHWMWTDTLDSKSSLTPHVREAIRTQARYEAQENNSYGKGLCLTLVNDTIGTGPRLQCSEFSHEVNQEIERAFHQWACAADLRDKLHVMRMAKLVDGEAVARFVNNMRIDDPVTLDLQLIECDQLRSPKFEQSVSERYIDGVRLDRLRNPQSYDILKHHPGSRYWSSVDYFKFNTYPVEQVIHLFRRDRPGQQRGVSELAPALPLFALLRRFTLATVSAAETAASVTQVISTDAPLPEDLEEDFAVDAFEKYQETIPIERNSATILPNQWKLEQFAAEHPTTTYMMFKNELVSEISRCLCIPQNVAIATTKDANFASARFDHLGYERVVKIEQNVFNRGVLDRTWAEWLIEAALSGLLPEVASAAVIAHSDEYGRRGLANRIEHTWHWDGLRDADLHDAAQAQRLQLQNGSTHRAKEYADKGLDVEVEDEKAAAALGMTKDKYRQWVAASIFTNGNIIEADPGAGGNSNGGSSKEAATSSAT